LGNKLRKEIEPFLFLMKKFLISVPEQIGQLKRGWLRLKTPLMRLPINFIFKKSSPTPKEFKEVLEIRLGRKQKDVIKEETVLAFLYAKIESDREAIKMKKKDALSENHIKTYVSLSRMFENYHIVTGTEIIFSDFNSKDFYWDFFKVVDVVYRGEIEVENPNQKKKQRKDLTGYGIK